MTHDENYDRALWQSARTKDGQVAELPYDYHRAWKAAHEEEQVRSLADLTRRKVADRQRK